MSAPAFAVTSPLTSRLLRRILLLCVLLILLFTGMGALWEYRQSLSETDHLLDSIEATALRPLANSLWDVNNAQVALQLEGFINIPAITYAAIVDRGRVLEERGQNKTKDVLTREIPIIYHHDDRPVPLGHLRIQADLTLAHAQALRAAYLSLAFNFCTLALVSLAIFLLTRSMVSRHLTAMARHFQSLRISRMGSRVEELRLDKKWAGDELDILCMAVNHMQENLASTYSQACAADQEAKSQARFPEENPNPVLRVGPDGLLSFANQASQGILKELGCAAGLPLPAPYGAHIQAALFTRAMQQFEAEFEGRTYAFVARPVFPDGYVNIYGMDITLRKEAMDAIKRSLTEKEILLKEIHHRVKNNLQIISSLLFLQMEHVSLPQDRELFIESQKRIQAMALVHEELYGARDLSSVDMREYVARLVERVLTGADIPVRVECRVDDVLLPVTRSIPCGLILNELVMNAVKHAFRPGLNANAEGVLLVSLRRVDGRLVLEVEDNGPGLPQGFDIAVTPTLGMTLVSSLSEQLGGMVSARNSSNGACFRLEMPLEDTGLETA